MSNKMNIIITLLEKHLRLLYDADHTQHNAVKILKEECYRNFIAEINEKLNLTIAPELTVLKDLPNKMEDLKLLLQTKNNKLIPKNPPPKSALKTTVQNEITNLAQSYFNYAAKQVLEAASNKKDFTVCFNEIINLTKVICQVFGIYP